MSRTPRARDSRRKTGVTFVERTIGSVVGALGRWVPSKRQRPARKDLASVGSDILLATGKDRGTAKALREHYARVKREMATLDQESERLHSLVAQGRARLGGPSGPALQKLIERGRTIREQIHEKRRELSRIEGHLSREQRLRGSSPPTRQVPVAPRAEVPPSRVTAAKSLLWGMGRPTSPRRQALERAVRHASFDDRSAAVAFRKAAANLLDPRVEVRRRAAATVAGLGNASTVEVLALAARDKNERVRLAALNGIASAGGARAVRILQQSLRDEHPSCRVAALRGLGVLEGGGIGHPIWLTALEDEDPEVRRTAVTVAGWPRRGRPASGRQIAALAFALRDESDRVRREAAEALGHLGDQRGVFALLATVGDPSGAVRTAGREAILRLIHEDVEEFGAGLDANGRVAALRAWWAWARPFKALDANAAVPDAPPPQWASSARDSLESVPSRGSSSPAELRGSRAPAPYGDGDSFAPRAQAPSTPSPGRPDYGSTSTDAVLARAPAAALPDATVRSSEARFGLERPNGTESAQDGSEAPARPIAARQSEASASASVLQASDIPAPSAKPVGVKALEEPVPGRKTTDLDVDTLLGAAISTDPTGEERTALEEVLPALEPRLGEAGPESFSMQGQTPADDDGDVLSNADEEEFESLFDDGAGSEVDGAAPVLLADEPVMHAVAAHPRERTANETGDQAGAQTGRRASGKH